MITDLHIKDEIEKIINSEDIMTVFQPIVSLIDGKIIGYEALSRGPELSLLHLPKELFSAAEKFDKTWELELLCRKKALEKAKPLGKDKLLFINIDPKIFKDEKFKKGMTNEYLKRVGINAESIIFEITERTSIEDYKSFKLALDNYLSQGYKIAIDDTGAGFSGLKLLTETRPQYVKIDMDLIRNIDKDTFKQALISAFVNLTKVTNMHLIAEGIETKEELKTLIDLNVYAGQGYYLQRPAGTFLDLKEDIINTITHFNKLKSNNLGVFMDNLEDIIRKEKPMMVNASCLQVKEHLEKNDIMGVCIVRDNYPVGLIMDHSLNSAMATQYGYAIFARRPISLLMDTEPLIINKNTSVTDIARLAMSRKNNKLYDYIIVTKDDSYYGVITIKDLLDMTAKNELNYAKKLNPLTGLPGNSIIEHVFDELLKKDISVCVLYIDLDNFKIYNDVYGFENGDKVLQYTSRIIQNSVKKFLPYNGFIGHIGGDDFVAVLQCPRNICEEICKDIISKFEKNIKDYFNEADIENGYLEGIDRKGNKDKFDLTSISIAGLYDKMCFYASKNDMVHKITEIKKGVKLIKRSNYIIS